MSARRAAVAVVVSLIAGGAVPLTLSLAHAAAPDCPVWTDAKGDAAASEALLGVAKDPSGKSGDPDVDIVAATVSTSPTELVAVLKLDKLSATPLHGSSDEFDIYFGLAGVTVNLFVIRTAAGKTVILHKTTDDPTATTPSGTADFNTTANTVTLKAKTSDVEKVTGKPVAGLPITKLEADTFDPGPASSTVSLASTPIQYDTAPGGTTTFAYGTDCVLALASAPTPTGTSTGTPSGSPSPTGTPSPSGSPSAAPGSKLANAGAVSSQYGDVASVGAKLTDASGAALVGKTVTFKLAGKTGSGKTNSAGVASVKLALAAGASSQTLVASFAGDASAKASSLSTKFTITTEKTKITMVVAKSGTARTVTATLLEDDNRALGSQKLVVYVNGAKKATLTTDAKGKVVYKAAKAGQTVKFAFVAVSGKWAASSVQQKLS